MPNILFQGYVLDDTGAAIVGATVNLYDRNTTTPVRATTTTDSTGLWTIAHATEGRFDVEIVNGSSKRRRKYDDHMQADPLEVANLRVRNPADTFEYDVVPAAIAADRQLNLPLITDTDTLAVLGLAQTFSDTTDATSPTTGAIKLSGGLGVAKSLYAGGDILVDAAGKRIAVRNPTNAGVVSVGGGKVSVDFVSITDNQSFTITMGASDALVIKIGRASCRERV